MRDWAAGAAQGLEYNANVRDGFGIKCWDVVVVQVLSANDGTGLTITKPVRDGITISNGPSRRYNTALVHGSERSQELREELADALLLALPGSM